MRLVLLLSSLGRLYAVLVSLQIDPTTLTEQQRAELESALVKACSPETLMEQFEKEVAEKCRSSYKSWSFVHPASMLCVLCILLHVHWRIP